MFRILKFIFITALFFLAIGLFNRTHAEWDYSQEIDIQLDLENSTSAFIKQKFILIGKSSQDLTNGFKIRFPAINYRISVITIDGKPATYRQINDEIQIDLSDKLLKDGEFTTIEIYYEFKNLVQNIYGKKQIFFPQPSNRLNAYKYNIIFDESKYNLEYVNNKSNSKSGEGIKEIYAIFTEKTHINTYSFELIYDKKDSDVVPFFSNQLYNITIESITGSENSIYDANKNYFLKFKDNQIFISGKVSLNNLNINSKPFLRITNDIESQDYSEIINDLISKYEPEIDFNEIPQDLGQLTQKQNLNNLEYAIVASAALSQNNINNKIFYGLVNSPYLTEQSIHYWLGISEDDKVIFIDPYFTDLFRLPNFEADSSRIIFGTLDEKNLDKVNVIEQLNNLKTVNLLAIDNNILGVNTDQVLMYLTQKGNYSEFNLINKSPYFIKINSSNNSALSEYFKEKLINPFSNVFEDLPLNLSNEDITIDYEINNIIHTQKLDFASPELAQLSFQLKDTIRFIPGSLAIAIIIVIAYNVFTNSKFYYKLKYRKK